MKSQTIQNLMPADFFEDLNTFFVTREDRVISYSVNTEHDNAQKKLEQLLNQIEIALPQNLNPRTLLIEVDDLMSTIVAVIQHTAYKQGFNDGINIMVQALAGGSEGLVTAKEA